MCLLAIIPPLGIPPLAQNLNRSSDLKISWAFLKANELGYVIVSKRKKI